MTDTATTEETDKERDTDIGCIIRQYRVSLEKISDKSGNVLPHALVRLRQIKDRIGHDGLAKEASELEQITGSLTELDEDLREIVQDGLLLYCRDGLKLRNLLLYEEVIEPVLEDPSMARKRHLKQVSVDHELSLEQGVRITGDEEHLKRVYTVLFTNATEHAPRRTHFSYGIEDKGDFYRLNVFNFSEKPLEGDIFERDQRLKSVRKIIEAHGGCIDIKVGIDNRMNYVNVVFTLPKAYDIGANASPQTH